MRNRLVNAIDEWWMGCTGDYASAEFKAENLLAALDPHKKETTYRIQQLHDGYKEVKVGDRIQLTGQFREEHVPVNRSISLREQVQSLQRELMMLRTGTFYRRNGDIRRVRIPKMSAYPLNPNEGERVLEEALAEIQQRPYYHDVVVEELVEDSACRIEKRRSNNSGRTRPQPRKRKS